MYDLTIENLIVSYPKQTTPVLDIPYLYLPSGKQLAVTGVSGSGKTTLVNLLSGLAKANSGTIKWADTDISKMSEKEAELFRYKNIGLILQDFHLYPGLNVIQNVLLSARFKYWSIPKELTAYAKDLLIQLGLGTNQHKQAIEKLSRGELQRVAIARAMLHKPSIIIADEPTASLDKNNGQQVIKILLDLVKQTQSSLICITHDLEFAAQLDYTINLTKAQPTIFNPLKRGA